MTTLELTNTPCGTELQSTVKQAAQERNSVLAGCNVHWLFRDSWTDLETGQHGIRWLLARILAQNNSIAPKFNSELYDELKANGASNETIDRATYRTARIEKGLTTEAIIERVRACNGSDKYPDQTIRDYLGGIMTKDNQVEGIQLSNKEDKNRPKKDKRPRKIWYLLAS